MKKLITTLIAIVMLVGINDASARSSRPYRPHHRPDVRTITNGLGVSFGYVHSAYRLSDWATDKVRTDAALNGFNIGLTKDFSLIYNTLYLQTGLVYTYQNSSNNKYTDDKVRIIGDRNEHFMSIPLKVKFEFPIVNDRMRVFVMAGPTIEEGLSAKMKYRATVGNDNSAVSYNYYNARIRSNNNLLDKYVESTFPETRYRRFDVQFGASAGVKFLNMFEAQIGYDWGLINKLKGDTIDDLRLKRQQFYISVGIRF